MTRQFVVQHIQETEYLEHFQRFAFSTGYADCVRCFFCGIGLKSWVEGDNPLVEHIRWRPNCGFLLSTKGRQFIMDTLAKINVSF